MRDRQHDVSDTSASARIPAAARRVGRRSGRKRADVLAHVCLVVGERGADATRFADVAEASGVPVSTLQYYFGTLDDMLIAAFRHAALRDVAAARTALAPLADPWERLSTACAFALGFCEAAAPYSWHLRVEAWRWAQRDPVWRAEVLADAADWRKIIAEAVAEGAAAGRFRADADPDQVALQALAMSGGIGLAAALPDPAVTAERAHRLLVDMLARLLGVASAPSVVASAPSGPPTGTDS
jgi:AcrR family transcriptional regulator